MKKMMAWILVLTMALSLCAGALGEGKLTPFWQAARELLTQTDNVTLSGEANFSLDGEIFKRVVSTYIQQGERSRWDYKLFTPRAGGEEKESGYTVIANGDKVYVMEVFYPGKYKSGFTLEQNSILRMTPRLDQVMRFGAVLADQAEALLGEEAVTLSADGTEAEIDIGAETRVPEIVNLAADELWQFAANRYFAVDTDSIHDETTIPLENFMTVTQGLLASTERVSLGETHVTVSRDENGLRGASGSISLNLETGKNGVKKLDIAFFFEVTDRGSSTVDVFNPSDFGVTLMEGAMNVDEDIYSEEEQDAHFSDEQDDELLEKARNLWKQLGFAEDLSGLGYTWKDDQFLHADFYGMRDGKEFLLTSFYAQDGTPLGFQNVINGWQGEANMGTYETYADTKLVEETARRLLDFLAEIDPAARERNGKLQNDWWYENEDGELYLQFIEDPLSQDDDGVSFVVRVAPKWRIEFYSSVSNG